MLKLNEEKEYLLMNYGFEPHTNVEGNVYYKHNKCKGISIFSSDGKVIIYSCSAKLLDILYDLIKDDIIIKIPEEDKTKKRIEKIKKDITKLQAKLKELEDA